MRLLRIMVLQLAYSPDLQAFLIPLYLLASSAHPPFPSVRARCHGVGCIGQSCSQLTHNVQSICPLTACTAFQHVLPHLWRIVYAGQSYVTNGASTLQTIKTSSCVRIATRLRASRMTSVVASAGTPWPPAGSGVALMTCFSGASLSI